MADAVVADLPGFRPQEINDLVDSPFKEGF